MRLRDEIRFTGPSSFEEAKFVHLIVIQLTQMALVGQPLEAEDYIRELKQWLDLVPMARVHFDLEVKRQSYACPSVVIRVSNIDPEVLKTMIGPKP